MTSTTTSTSETSPARDTIEGEGANNQDLEDTIREIDLLDSDQVNADQALENINADDSGFELDNSIFGGVEFADQNMVESSMASVSSTVDVDLDFLSNENEWQGYHDPLFSHPPNIASERSRKPASSRGLSETPAYTQCNCLSKVAHLLDHIAETASSSIELPYDGSLAYLQHISQECSKFLECSDCMTRSEFCMLFLLAIEKMVLTQEKMASQLVPMFSSNQYHPDKIDGLRGGSSCRFGSYSLSTAEHLLVSRLLFVRQVEGCKQLLQRVRIVPTVMRRESQVLFLSRVDRKIGSILESLEKVSPGRKDSGFRL